jgi:hypothetical protein
MGILDWFKRKSNSDSYNETTLPSSEDLVFETGKEEVAGLNFKTAIEAHMQWKHRLKAVIEGNSKEQLDPSVICRDDQCVLGKWIYGEGIKRYMANGVFRELREHHAQFHRCAGEVLRVAQTGALSDAEKMLNTGEYLQTSVQVALSLGKLYTSSASVG